MYEQRFRARALALLNTGLSMSEVSRELGVSRSSLRDWMRSGVSSPSPRAGTCPRCADAALDSRSYAALFGYYLGDGCISQAARCQSLRIACDANYPLVVKDAEQCIRGVRSQARVFLVRAPGTIVVHSNWKHWSCLFPQHGRGRKHERHLGMLPWQWELVREHPGDFLRGLFHSDGSRSNNWTTREVGGQSKRYDYPRWEFSNRSEEILGWSAAALDLTEIRWRRSSKFHIAVSRREAVARLDQLIGLKS